MNTRSAKNKGKRLQNWICEQLSKISGLSYGKDEDIASREMGQTGIDVRLSPKARKIISWSIEAKNQERLNWYDAIKQAKENQMPNTDWLLIVKKNRFEPVAILDAEVFFNLIEKVIKK